VLRRATFGNNILLHGADAHVGQKTPFKLKEIWAIREQTET
jgi:hypothetical protein